MARVAIDFGQEHFEADVRDEHLVAARRRAASPALRDIPAAVRQALNEPLDFPSLRQALTPDDHVAIIVTEDLSHLPDLLTPVIEHVREAGLTDQQITLLCPPRGAQGAGSWVGGLPEDLRGMRVEVHNPADRRKLSYLASTQAGRRIYLNRTLVDADQLVVLGRIGYDPVLGYAGGLGDLFPWMSDEATRSEFLNKTSASVPDDRSWPAEQEAQEVGWLLGMPFILQVVEGAGDDLLHVLGGLAKSVADEGRRLLDRHWRVTVDRSADLVVAGITGRQNFANVTRALASAARVVKPGGRIVILSRAEADLGPSAAYLRQADDPAKGLALARKHHSADAMSAWQLATAAEQAKLYLLSNIPGETAEELFATPLEQPGQVQKLIDAAESCLFLPDAHRTLAVVAAEKPQMAVARR